jgi:tRNA(fMet)-specific endonuclease VapC
VSGIVADTSEWVEYLSGRHAADLDRALANGAVVLSPVVVAELVSGTRSPKERAALVDLLSDLPLHETPVAHWVRVGDLRRQLRARGLSVSTPDAHVAQCALDREARLLSRDRVFARIAKLCPLDFA